MIGVTLYIRQIEPPSLPDPMLSVFSDPVFDWSACLLYVVLRPGRLRAACRKL
jgi:hypothetical protein